MASSYNYFNALTQMADYACEVARYFDRAVNDFDPARLPQNIGELHQIEHAADEKRHEIMHNLAKEFLPPIEREDIVDLSSTIDDIIDCVDDLMQHLYLYNVGYLLPECKDFSKLIVECCESVGTIAGEFKNFRKSQTISGSIIHTNKLEGEGDRLYAKMMREIFTSDMPVKDVFIWTRIVTLFEDCCDYCEEASALFESAVIKNS